MTNTQISSHNFQTSVIGVDLGSAFTKIAAVTKGKIDIITNQANLRQTPTIVAYGPNQRLMGQSGHAKIKSNLSNTVLAPHRYLGLTKGEYIDYQSKHAPSSIKIKDEELYWSVNCQGNQTQLCPEQVVAAFINKIQHIVKLNKLQNKFIVFTVPDYYTHHEKQSLLDAIQIAKLSFKKSYGVCLVNQSTAVGMDYGFYKQKQFTDREQDGKNVLFIDFGHSKLSVYVINFTKNYQKTIYKKQIRQLGCKTLDQLMLAFYANLFHQNNPQTQISLWQSRKALCKLQQNIQKQRKVLSGNSQYDFNIECLLQDKDIAYTMKRQQFQDISKPAINTIRQFFNEVRSALIQMNIRLSSIQLVGGGSRVPLFIRTVKQIFQMQPSRTLNSSECIARGAALCSAMKSNIFRVLSYPSFDASAHQIVCNWRGDGQQIKNQQNQVKLLQLNQTIFSTKSLNILLNTDKKKIKFFVQYRNIPQGLRSCFCQFDVNLSQQSASERKIKINFNFNNNQMIDSITAYQLKQKQQQLPITDLNFFKKYSHEWISKFALIQQEQTNKDALILKEYEETNIAQSQIYSMKQKVEQSLRDTAYKEFIDPAIYNQYVQYFQQISSNLNQIDNLSNKMQQARQKLAQYYNIINDFKNKYSSIEEELKKLTDYMNAVVSGKIKNVRYYPGQDFSKVSNWIKSIAQAQKNKKKYQQHTTNVEEVKKVLQDLKFKVQQCQVDRSKKQKLLNHSQYLNHPIQNQERYSFKQPSGYKTYSSPFQSHFQPRNRASRFNNYEDSKFRPFSGFSGFF